MKGTLFLLVGGERKGMQKWWYSNWIRKKGRAESRVVLVRLVLSLFLIKEVRTDCTVDKLINPINVFHLNPPDYIFFLTSFFRHCPKYYNFTTNRNHILPIIYPAIVLFLGFWCTEKLTFHLAKTAQKISAILSPLLEKVSKFNFLDLHLQFAWHFK